MGNKDKNPLDKVMFYNSKEPNKSFKKLEKEISMVPEQKQTTAIRLFVKDESKFLLAK